jgi:hypothetical protein
MQNKVKTSDIPDQEIIDACNAFHNSDPIDGQTPDEALAHKYPVKVIMNKMAKMVRQGILNYGVSLRTAWVEKK